MKWVESKKLFLFIVSIFFLFEFGFQVKYVGDEKEKQGSPMEGLNQMDKTLVVKGARISYCIWEVQGNTHIYIHREREEHMLFLMNLGSLMVMNMATKKENNGYLFIYGCFPCR